MKFIFKNYYGFDHARVNKMFEGDLTYVCDLVLKGEDRPVAVYKAKKPNLKKGHKKYMLLQAFADEEGLVRGLTPREMSKHRTLNAVQCLECDKILVSFARHDFVSCGCPNHVFADGGSSYGRFGAKSFKKVQFLQIDALTGKVMYEKKRRERPVRKLQKNASST